LVAKGFAETNDVDRGPDEHDLAIRECVLRSGVAEDANREPEAVQHLREGPDAKGRVFATTKRHHVAMRPRQPLGQPLGPRGQGSRVTSVVHHPSSYQKSGGFRKSMRAHGGDRAWAAAAHSSSAFCEIGPR